MEETPAVDVASEVGPSSSVVGTSVAGPSTSSTNLHTDLGAGVKETKMAMAGSSVSVPTTNEA